MCIGKLDRTFAFHYFSKAPLAHCNVLRIHDTGSARVHIYNSRMCTTRHTTDKEAFVRAADTNFESKNTPFNTFGVKNFNLFKGVVNHGAVVKPAIARFFPALVNLFIY